VLLNWELPIGSAVNAVPRQRGRRALADPHSLSVISKWAPGYVTLATNHILDGGAEGLSETIEKLRQIGFATVGAGITSDEITKPAIWETSDGRLGIVNWVFPETHPDWMAIPGPNCWPGIKEARNVIQQVKLQSDWVMVVVHWSDELFPYPRPKDRIIAHELAKMGVDLIVGHHPHVVRGMEHIGSCPVFYSIGNFYFSDIPDGNGRWITREAPRNREGLGVLITFRRGKKPAHELLSFWNTKREAVSDPLRRAYRRSRSTSIPLQIHSGDAYAEWYKAQRARFDKWDIRWHFALGRRRSVSTLRRAIMRLRGSSPEFG